MQELNMGLFINRWMDIIERKLVIPFEEVGNYSGLGQRKFLMG